MPFLGESRRFFVWNASPSLNTYFLREINRVANKLVTNVFLLSLIPDGGKGMVFYILFWGNIS